mgnify:CR=1 FL=1
MAASVAIHRISKVPPPLGFCLVLCLAEQDRELLVVTKKNETLERKLRIANALIALPKKAHELLGLALPDPEEKN